MIHLAASFLAYLAVAVVQLQPIVAAPGPSQDPWPRHVIDDSSRGADGIKHDIVGVVDLNGDDHPDVITTEERASKNHTGLGVIWYENPGHFETAHLACAVMLLVVRYSSHICFDFGWQPRGRRPWGWQGLG